MGAALPVRLERVAQPTLAAIWPAPDPAPSASPLRTDPGRLMATAEHRRADTVAGFLCAFSLALSGIALARSPGLLAPVAILVALVAVRMTEAHRTLAAVALAVSGFSFFFGMTVAIVTDSPLY